MLLDGMLLLLLPFLSLEQRWGCKGSAKPPKTHRASVVWAGGAGMGWGGSVQPLHRVGGWGRESQQRGEQEGLQGQAHPHWDAPKSPRPAASSWATPRQLRLGHSRDGSHRPLCHPQPGWTIPAWKIFGSCRKCSKTVQSWKQTAPGGAELLKLAGVPQAEATWGFGSFHSQLSSLLFIICG